MAGTKPGFGYWGSASEELLKSQFPLHCACRDGEVESLALLLHEAHHGIYAEDSFYGWTPAHWAAYFGKLGCLRKLMMVTGVGANCDVKSSRFNQTPTHMAAFGGHPHCLQWLLQSNADMNAKDYLGETPIHKAARTGSIECSSLLVSHGADVKMRNYNGMNPSELAKSCNYSECSQYLEGAIHAAEQKSLRGIHQELMPPTSTLPPAPQPAELGHTDLHPHTVPPPGVNSHCPSIPNGHITNGSPENDCEMEMESDESHVAATNGFSGATNGFSAVSDGHGARSMVNGGLNGFSNSHVNGFGNEHMNGHHINSHSNGHKNGFGDGRPIDDVLLDSGVSTNRALVGGRKRLCEDAEEGEMKRRRHGEPVVRDMCNGLPVTLDVLSPAQAVSGDISTSAVEHYSSMTVQQGYDSMFYDSMLSQTHGC